MTKFSDVMRGIEQEAKIEGPEAMSQLEELRDAFRSLVADASLLLKEDKREEFLTMAERMKDWDESCHLGADVQKKSGKK